MWHRAAIVVSLAAVTAAPALAQSRPPRLASVVSGLFGPNGLVVNSDAAPPDEPPHSIHFNNAFQNFRQLNIGLASQLTSLPLPSPASAFTYRFDQSTGTFVRSTQSFGPILTDRADTIGRGRFAFGYNFQYFNFDRHDGHDLSRIPSVFTHDQSQLGGSRADVVTTLNAIDVSVGQWTGALTYGISDRVDVSLAVPIVQTSIRAISEATIRRLGTAASPAVHFFRDPDAAGGIGSERSFEASGSATGLGDLIVRVKGAMLRQGQRGLAVGLDLRMPTGDERNLLGSGAPGVKPFLAYSGAYRRVSPHVNFGYQWNGDSVLAGDVETGDKSDLPDQLFYAFGADIGVTDKFSLTADWMGRRAVDAPRIRVDPFTATGAAGAMTFDALAVYRESFWASSAAVGFKANLSGRLLVDFNLRFAVGSNGLTDRVTPLIGIEYGF